MSDRFYLLKIRRLDIKPEDVGGPPGYSEFCAVMNNPGHNEHEDFMEWYGGEFDRDAFDPDYVTCELSKYLHWSRDRIPGWEKDDSHR